MHAVRSMKWLALAALFAFAPMAAGAQARPAAPGQSKNTSPVSAVVQGAAETGEAVNGVFDVVGFYVDEGQVWASGTFSGTVNGDPVSTAARAPVLLNGGIGALSQHTGACPILELNIGAIHLDLLGLVVDLSPIDLTIVAQPGSGNLLGNLLCAVAGLLDPGPSPIAGLLQQIATLLNAILGILSP
jgi:hypothetical protein